MAYKRIIKWSSIVVGVTILLGIVGLVAAIGYLYIQPVYLSQKKAQILRELNSEHADYHIDFETITIAQFKLNPGILIENAKVRLKTDAVTMHVPRIEMRYGISNFIQFTFKPTAVSFVNASIFVNNNSNVTTEEISQHINVVPERTTNISYFDVPTPRPRYTAEQNPQTDFLSKAQNLVASFVSQETTSPLKELSSTKKIIQNLQSFIEHQIWQTLQVNNVRFQQAKIVFSNFINGVQDNNYSKPFDLEVQRYDTQNLSVTFSGVGKQSPWQTKISAYTNAQKSTELLLDFKNISPVDFAIYPAFTRIDSLINANIKARFSVSGFVEAANAQIEIGNGNIIWTQDPVSSTQLREMIIRITTDADAKRLIIQPSIIRANGFSTEIEGAIDLPYQETSNTNLQLNFTANKTFVEGAQLLEAKDDAPDIYLPKLTLIGVYNMVPQVLKINQLLLQNDDIHLEGAGLIDVSGAQPMVRFVSENFKPISIGALRTMWPQGVVPDAREWLMKNAVAGTVVKTSLNASLTRKDLDAMANRGVVEKDNFLFQMHVENAEFLIEGTNARVKTPFAVMKTIGSEVSFSAQNADFVIKSNTTSHITLENLTYDLPDAQLKVPTAHLNTRVSGDVERITQFLVDHKILLLSEKDSVVLSKTSGNFAVDIRLIFKVEPVISPEHFEFSINGQIQNFLIPEVINGVSVDTRIAKIFADNQLFELSGETQYKGQFLRYKFLKPSKNNAFLEFSITDALRQTLFPNAALPISGDIAIKLLLNEDPAHYGVELDLKQTKIDLDVIGYSKKIGVPAYFKVDKLHVGVQEVPLIETSGISFESTDLNFKGSAKFLANGTLLELNLPQVSWGQTVKDNFSIEIIQNNNKPNIKVKAQKFDARPFIQKLTISSANSGDTYKSATLELVAKQVVGFGDETLDDVFISGEKNNGSISALTLSANRNAAPVLVGKIQHDAVAPFMYITSSNAGLLLKFLNLTNSVRGGNLQFSEYLPRQQGEAVSGVIFIENFWLENDRTISGLVGSVAEKTKIDETNVPMQFDKLRLEFTRAPNLISIKNSVMRGPVMGLTFEGEIDPRTNLLDITGTFVPLYGVNNAFSKIPLLGEILGGGDKNEGLIGVTYAVRGSMTNSLLRINPISGIAPGFLRRIFDFEPKPLHPPKRPPIDLSQ